MSASMANMLVCCKCQILAKSAKLRTIQKLLPFQRKYCTIVNHKLKIDPLVDRELSEEKYKHKQHPGALRVPSVQIPNELGEAIRTINEKNPIQNVKEKALSLENYLWRRELPLQLSEREKLSKQYEDNFRSKDQARIEKMTEEEREVYEQGLRQRVQKRVNRTTYNWEPIRYDGINGILYMNGKLFFDYACIYKIFFEISKRVPEFNPKSVFDFGSGLGSTVWAANSIWKNSLTENFCVDVSEDMNKINQLLLQGGHEHEDPFISGVYIRQFFPVSTTNQYDIVVSAFSLFELPTVEDRLMTLSNLWKKTQQFMVIIENGSYAGFRVITEARRLILEYSKNAEVVEMNGHVFSPCPHKEQCPKLMLPKRTPCNFSVTYSPHLKNKSESAKLANFSYIVLRKGPDTQEVKWPRLIRPNKSKSKHVHCWSCNINGQLEQSTITAAKHGKNLYRCAKSSELGDLLPALPRDDDNKE